MEVPVIKVKVALARHDLAAPTLCSGWNALPRHTKGSLHFRGMAGNGRAKGSVARPSAAEVVDLTAGDESDQAAVDATKGEANGVKPASESEDDDDDTNAEGQWESESMYEDAIEEVEDHNLHRVGGDSDTKHCAARWNRR